MQATILLLATVALLSSPMLHARGLPKPFHRAIDPQGLSDTIIGAIDDLTAELATHGSSIREVIELYQSGQDDSEAVQIALAALNRLKAQLSAEFEIDGDAIFAIFTTGTEEEQAELIEQYIEVYIAVFAHLTTVLAGSEVDQRSTLSKEFLASLKRHAK
ncbi:hypothetical protein BV898_03221 [Hypsibius exemplaris]|uniref:Uncharacterized protein n=1 Tax=Hypsibius exemplaris TaxID=2072580 RepID=A0A1W0X5Y5_HYPEX|nr:hypothetical protein BV898_03221 [Hypsibius exemplaris]